MPQCAECGRWFVGHEESCLACSNPLGPVSDADAPAFDSWERTAERLTSGPSDDRRVALARFKNAAEAGFFAHELARLEDVPSTLNVDESFDAISGHWTTRFVLSVPAADSERAARALAQLIEQTDEPDDRFASRPHDYADSDEPFAEPGDSGVNWVPIVLTLTAGSVMLWASRAAEEPPKRELRAAPVGGQHDLWDELSRRPGTWVQPPENGRGRRELTIDPDTETAVLREDINGDGLFDTVTRIPRHPRRW